VNTSGQVRLNRLVWEGGVEFIAFLLNKAVLLAADQPVFYKDIARLPSQLREQWKKACQEELEALRKCKVFELADLPPGHKAIKNHWVFTTKSDSRKKARLVAKGFSQVEGIDFDQIFSLVVRYKSVCLLLATAALEQWHIEGLDVKSAFLYRHLDEEIYMEQPEGFKIHGQEQKVLRLCRAIYGLKQAALAWWKELLASMRKMGFEHFQSDAGIFIHKASNGDIVVAMIYIDDSGFMDNNVTLVKEKKKAFMGIWECHDLGELNEFLGITIRCSGRKIILDQKAYLTKVLDRFGMTNAIIANTPLPHVYTPVAHTGNPGPTLRTQYQAIIGSLLYLMLGTRPDITFAVIKLSQFSANPSKEHFEQAKYICHYLAGTQDYTMVFDGNTNEGLIVHSDSDWAADINNRHSITGYFFKLARSSVSWLSRAQKTVALSSTEAEYMAISDCCQQAMWITNLFREIGFPILPITICGDNQGSLFIGSNPVQEKWTKHIDICYHYIRECIEDNKVSVVFVPGNDNLADMFTKNLDHLKFVKF